MRLEAEAPLRVVEAVLNGLLGMEFAMRTVHGLEEKVLKIELFEAFGFGARLWEYQFELMAGMDFQGGAGFWAHADPVDAGGWCYGAIGFDGNFETALVEGCDEGFIEL